MPHTTSIEIMFGSMKFLNQQFYKYDILSPHWLSMSTVQTAINNICHHGVSGLTKLWINLYEYYEREGVEEIHFDLCSMDDSYDEPMQISIAEFRDKAIEIILTTSGHGLAYFRSILVTLSIIDRYAVSQVWAGFTATYKMRIVAQYQGHEYSVEKETVSYK